LYVGREEQDEEVDEDDDKDEDEDEDEEVEDEQVELPSVPQQQSPRSNAVLIFFNFAEAF